MAYSAYDLNKKMDKVARDRAWRDRMAKPSQYNRYERHLADSREKEKLDAANQREMALENRRQLGALDVQKENSRGAFARQGLENKGLMNRKLLGEAGLDRRLSTSEAGLDRRLGRTLDYKREAPIFKEFKTKETDPEGFVAETSDWKNLNTKGGLIHGGDGGSADPKDMDSLSKETSGEAASPNNTQERYAVTRTRKNGPEYVEYYNGAGNLVDPEESMPTGTHQLNPADSAPAAPSQPVFPRTLESAHTPGTSQSPQKAFGESFIRSNLGHSLGIDKAHNMATGFNRSLSGAWGLSNQLGNAIIKRGIKPAVQWATQEYKDPYQRRKY